MEEGALVRTMHALIVGLIVLIVVYFMSVTLYHETYARESYDISECGTTHKFANLTLPRSTTLAVSYFVNPSLVLGTTVLVVYDIQKLRASELWQLFNESTTNERVFFGFGESADKRAVVFLEEIVGKKEEEEPLYCVVSTKKIANTKGVYYIAVREGRKDEIPIVPKMTVVSWGSRW